MEIRISAEKKKDKPPTLTIKNEDSKDFAYSFNHFLIVGAEELLVVELLY